MAFVLDASTALNLILPEERATTAARGVSAAFLRGECAQVPSLWRMEVANVLLVAERRERIATGSSFELLAKLLELPIEVAPDVFGWRDHTFDVLRTAGEFGLSAYDATYLCLARARGLPLATNDARLIDAAGRAGVARLAH